MEITFLKPHNINFSGKIHTEEFDDDFETRQFADDWGGSKVRDALRAHIMSQFLPSYGLENEKLSHYAETLDDVFIPNLRKIGHGAYRGSSLAKNLNYMSLLPKSNITTVIDLTGYDSLKKACDDNNIDYFRYEVANNYWANPIFADDEALMQKKHSQLFGRGLCKEEFDKEIKNYKAEINNERRRFMNKFIEFVNVINQGFFYIGCDFGEYRTPNILALNTYFNPRKGIHDVLPTNEFILESIKNMYKNLTDNEKIRLGFTEEYDKKLKKDLEIKTSRS